MNKWFQSFLSSTETEGGPFDTGDTFHTLNTTDKEKEEEVLPVYISISPSEDVMSDEYTVRLISGRKVYEGNGKQLPVWSKELCEDRIRKMLESGKNHGEFFIEAAEWHAKQPDKMHTEWAGDCLHGLEQAYEVLNKSLEAEQSKPKPKLFASVKTPESKPKLFGAKTNA